MEDYVKEYLGIAISLTLFGLLLAFIVYLSSTSFSLLSIGKEREAFNKELEVRRELAQFDNREVTGDDILVVARKFTKVYTIKIYTGSPDTPSIVLNRDDTVDVDNDGVVDSWSLSSIRKALGTRVNSLYDAKFVRYTASDTSYSNYIGEIEFRLKTN